jgi:hypothetical protein
MHYISNSPLVPLPTIDHRSSLTMSTELEKSRLAVADEVKFDMLAAISDSGDHAKQYKTISRNLVCECFGMRPSSTIS